MHHPKDIGDRSTLAIMFALQGLGLSLFVPFGENVRYDLVVDYGTRLSRVQCKTGRYRNGAVAFNSCSSYAHHPNPKALKRDYTGEIDEFAVYCPDLGTVYVIPIEDVSTKRVCALRIDPPRNNQRQRVRLAAAYEIARFDVI